MFDTLVDLEIQVVVLRQFRRNLWANGFNILRELMVSPALLTARGTEIVLIGRGRGWLLSPHMMQCGKWVINLYYAE
jgi:hypothetical protein